MTNYLEGIRTLTGNSNILSMGFDLALISIIIIFVIATSIKAKDKMLLITLSLSMFSIIGLFQLQAIALITAGSGVMTAIMQLKD